jgi:surfactin synthase thioesterase subunit
MNRDDPAWFVPLTPDDGLPLFAFPHAGAGCAQLADFAKQLAGHGVTVRAANLPGRQARLAEAPVTDISGLADTLADALAAEVGDRPYALFGYCGGALLAYETARRLQARSVPMPTRLIVVSFEAPDIGLRPRRVSRLPSHVLWTYLLDSGAVQEDHGQNAALRRVAEPAIRADYTMLGTYHHEPGPPLTIPLTVCHGERDTGTPRGALLGWRRLTTGPVDLRGLDAGHWLLTDAGERLAEITAEAVRQQGDG